MKKIIAWLISGIIFVMVIVCCVWFILFPADKSGNSDNNTHNNAGADEDTEDIYNEKEIPIYTINYDTMECEPSVIVVPDSKSISERYIVDEVIANFREQVSIYDVIVDKDRVIVSFCKNSAPAVNVSKEMESVMLDCISYSLIDNLDDCNCVGFRIEDEPYEGVAITMGYDESYVEK